MHAHLHALKDSPPCVFIPLTMLPLSRGVKCLVLNYRKQFLHKAAFNEDCLSPRKLNRGSVKILALMKVSKQDACGSLGTYFVYAVLMLERQNKYIKRLVCTLKRQCLIMPEARG